MSNNVDQADKGWYQPKPLPPGPTYLVFADRDWLDQHDLTAVNDQLESGAGWSLRRESDAAAVTEPVVIPLLLSPGAITSETTPQGALGVLRGMASRQDLQLDRLLIDGMPAHKPGALTRGDFNQVPVAVMTPSPPPRQERNKLQGDRRPVIALFDTAISRHPWLDTSDSTDPIWIDAEDYGCKLGPRAPARGTLRGAMSTSKGLESDFGHGTFSAGLIRQIAPDALILLFRVMHEDGTIHGDHILNALGWINEGPTSDGEATVDHPRPDVDVICLPLGFELESKDATFTKWLAEVLGDLGDRGVQVVASAGNDGTDQPTYPAAFTLAEKQPRTPLVSVGALNPSGRTRAHYSNYGDWVTDWAVGTSVVSTFPLVDGVANPELGGGGTWESVDPDDFTGGFSRWSGTSFAATVLAGMFAQALLTPAAAAARTPHERAEIALRACRQGA